MSEAMDRAERVNAGLILCGPRALTREDITIVQNFRRWLQGDRDVWDDEGNDVVQPNQGEQ